MLNVGIIGIGNAGNQVALLGKKLINVDSVAINCSENDLKTLGDVIPTYTLGDAKGAGKNRNEAKESLRKSINDILRKEDFINFFGDKDVVYIVSSTGGGTGSGISPLFYEICSQIFPDVCIIIVAILPTLLEGLSTQANTLDYLTELYETLDKPRYMIYDNERLSNLPSHIMMQKINESIVRDIEIMECRYNTLTRFSSIDEKDMMTILGTPGRFAVASLYDIKEKDFDDKSIEDALIFEIKHNTHAELQRDGIVNRTGIITNLSETLSNMFNTHIPNVQEFIGAPVEEFEHIVVNEERRIPNHVFLIMAGLSKITDRIRKINERIEEIQEKQSALLDEDDVLKEKDLGELNKKREYRNNQSTQTSVNIDSIFSRFSKN